jgi:hypothetical protein
MKRIQYPIFAAAGVAFALTCALFPRPGFTAELMDTPLYSARTVALLDGVQAYQVECHGLLESGKACAVKARRICDTVAQGSHVRPLMLSQPLNTIDRSPEPDYRSIMFLCENGNEAK